MGVITVERRDIIIEPFVHRSLETHLNLNLRNGDTQSDGDKEEKPSSVEVLNSTSVQTQTFVSFSERVLLQTAIVSVQSGDKTEIVSVKVLLDSANHRSFITETLAKQLKLTPQYKESLSVSTFAAKKPQDVRKYIICCRV